MKNENNQKKQNKGGRIPKMNPSIHRYVFRLNEEENAKLLALFEEDSTNKIQLSPMNTSRGKNQIHSVRLGQFDRVAFKRIR